MKGKLMFDQEPIDMNDREIAEESLMLLRGFRDALMGAAQNPMVGAMLPGLKKLGQ
jgi:hypothetical protein